ncbi:MAG: hypothetical protein Q7S28_02680 [bacterium]|nr:hypothetical protein [bacterium]
MNIEQDPSKKREIAEGFENLKDCIAANEKIVGFSDPQELTWRGKIFAPRSATLSYYDEKTKFDVRGYNLTYWNDDGNIYQARIFPGLISSLKNKGGLHEREEIEDELKNFGFVIDNSEWFHMFIKNKIGS